MAAKPKDVDRVGLEIGYRAGIKSLRALGAEFGLSGARVAQIADEEGWTRDLKARVQAVAEAKLNSRILDAKLDADKVEREEQVVDALADERVDIVVSQRKDIKRSRDLGIKLFAELESLTDNRELFDILGEMLYSPDDKGRDKRNEIYQKVISIPGRVSSYKALTDAIKTMIGLERQAYGMADNANGEADKTEDKTHMSEQETARRIAFVFASAMHKKEPSNG